MTSARTDLQSISAEAFLKAATTDDIETINAYIAANRNNPSAINIASEGSGSTALILAAGFGHEAVVAALLAVPGIDIARKNSAGLDALAFAKQRKRTAIVTLLDITKPVIATNTDVISAEKYLHAAKTGDIDKVRQYILSNNSNRDAINIKDPETHDTALILAVRHNHEMVVDILVGTRIVDVYATNKQRETAGTIAQRNGHVDIASRLAAFAEANADVNTSTSATSSSSVDDDGDQPDSSDHSLDDYKCPVSRMIFFKPTSLISCGHTLEGDYINGENGCTKLGKCPLCRKAIVSEFKIKTPEDIALSYKQYIRIQKMETTIESELQKNPKLYNECYFNPNHLKNILERNELETPTGKKFLRFLENSASHIAESLAILVNSENGRNILRTNHKVRELVSQQIKNLQLATFDVMLQILALFKEWPAEKKAELVLNYSKNKSALEQEDIVKKLANVPGLAAELQSVPALQQMYLASAANAGDLDKVKALVAHGANINAVLGLLIGKQKSALLWWLHTDKSVRDSVTLAGMQSVIPEGKYQKKTVADALLHSKKGCQLLIEDERLHALCPEQVEGKTILVWLNAKKTEQNFSQSGFFAAALSPEEAKKKSEAKQAKKMLECVLFPNVENIKKLKDMAKTMPQCFFIKVTALDQAMDLEGNRRTIEDWSPYQAMFGTGDNDLLEELKPDLDKYLANMPNGFEQNQVKEKFPNAFDLDGKGFDFPPSTYNFNPLAVAISGDQQLKNTGIPSPATQALMIQLQAAFKPGVVKTGHHFNMNDVIKAREIYEANFNPWDINQLSFFSKNVIGFLQRLETGVYLQSDRTGLVNLVGDNKKPLQRDYEVVNYVLDANGEKNTVLLPLASADSVSVLGRDFVVESFGGRVGGGRAGGGFWLSKNLCRAKTAGLSNLCRGAERNVIQNRAGV